MVTVFNILISLKISDSNGNQLACSGIPPGGNFAYVVPMNTDNQWGTYWVHAHSSVSSTGMFRSFCIEANLMNRGNTWTVSVHL